jgi:hypothetical protein
MNLPSKRPLPTLSQGRARCPHRAGLCCLTLLCIFLSVVSTVAASKDSDTFNAVQQILTNRLPIVVDNLLDVNRRLNSVELKLSTLSNQPSPANVPAAQVDMRAITQAISSTITELNKGTLNQVTQAMTSQWSKLTNELAATISAHVPKATSDSSANVSESLSNLNRNVSILLNSRSGTQAAQPNGGAKSAAEPDSSLMLWGITLGVISLANLGAIFWLFGVSQIASKRVEAVYQAVGQIYNSVRDGGPQSAAEQAEAMLQRIQLQTTRAHEQTTQRANAILQQAENQAMHTQEKLLAAISEFRSEARNSATLIEQKLSTAQLEPLSKGAERLSKTLDVFEGRLEATRNVFNNFENASVQLKQQIEERKHLETLEKEAKDKLHVLEQQKSALLEARNSFQSEQSEVTRQDGEMNRVLWPAAFLNGAMGNWRKRITGGVLQGDLAATTLWLAMVHVGALCRQPTPALSQIAAALHNMSVEAHRFWKDGTDDFNETTIRWRDEFNALIASRRLPLQIQAIHPEDRFDGDRMVCAEGSSNSRLAVKEPLSWAIVDRSNPERPKVLHHAVVLTA